MEEEGQAVCIKSQLPAGQDLQRLQLRSYGAMISRDCLLGLSAPTAELSGISRITRQQAGIIITNTTHAEGGLRNQKTQKTRQMDKLNKT